MKKFMFVLFTVTLVMVSVTGCGSKKTLTLYTWDAMFPQDILRTFERETGVKINYVIFDTNETMLANLKSSKGAGYDLIIADDYIIETAVAQGLAQKLDKARLPNYKNINPLYQKQFYDPKDEYTVPYGAGILTIVYDPSRVNVDIMGYYDLWNPVLSNSLGIIANFRVINGIALKVLGESYNTNNLKSIRDAGEILLLLAPNIRLIQDDYLEDELISGNISAGIMYTSQVTHAKMADPGLKIVFPEEGIGFGIMAGFIPSKARNPQAAHAFLNFIMDAIRGASCFEYLGYYSTYSASDFLIAPEYKDLLTLPKELNVDMEMIKSISPEAEQEHNLIWSAFRKTVGQ